MHIFSASLSSHPTIISLEYLYLGIHSQGRHRQMSRQGRRGLSSLPGLFASTSICPAILSAPLPRSSSASFYPVIYIVRKVSSESPLCKQSRRDEKNRDAQ